MILMDDREDFNGLDEIVESHEREVRIFSKSPFLYYDQMKYILSNSKSDCTYEEISDLCIKGRLTDTDLTIMDSLFKYRFLNRYCIEKSINDATSSLKKNLSKLVAHGIILRFYFSWDQDAAAYRTPSFYALSKGAYSYYKKKNPFKVLVDGNIKNFDIPSEVNLLERLVFNQFHIHFMNKYQSSVIRESYSERVSLRGYDFTIEGCFRLKISNLVTNFKWFDMVVIPIRRNPFWQKEFLSKLSLIYAYAKRHPSKLRNPTILVICEDDVQAKEAFACKYADGQTRDIFTLFTSDVAIVTHDVLDWLYYCEYRSVNEIEEESGDGTDLIDDPNSCVEPIEYDDLKNYSSNLTYDPLDNLSRAVLDEKRIYLSVRSLIL